ncbi:hypothetical protein DCO48_20045 [Pseudomonas sp. SDI]|uniref:hypothetical protein n=1 Tax=Pseudomonas sp. SDI TaxID=2170734 RepID=UPI000DE5E2BF|nr:hypothetical protein [Pseudomonas sp. SDI]PWB30538.1 hypothetical protein DCO48_20045 [Pseudomonas sp. SDI]
MPLRSKDASTHGAAMLDPATTRFALWAPDARSDDGWAPRTPSTPRTSSRNCAPGRHLWLTLANERNQAHRLEAGFDTPIGDNHLPPFSTLVSLITLTEPVHA